MKKLFRKILVYELLNQNSTKKAEPALFFSFGMFTRSCHRCTYLVLTRLS